MRTKEEFEQLRTEYGIQATHQQQLAADPLKSVWVEASAGTGKTKVLSDRVLRLLLNGVNPQRILCLTYTKAAAVEMNSRISERLSAWSVMSEAELEESLFSLLGQIDDVSRQKKYKQRARTLFAILLDTPGGIKIQTIHSFCQEVLKRFPLEAGVSPYFDILDDETAAAALAQIQKELLEKTEYGADCPLKRALQYLTENVSEYTFPKLMTNITANRSKIVGFLNNYQSEENFHQVLAQKLQIEADKTETEIMAEFMAGINVSALRADIAALSKGGKKNQKMSENLENLLLQGLKTEDYPAYKSLFLTQKGELIQKIADKNSTAADGNLPERLQREGERLLQTEQMLRKMKLFAATKSVFSIAGELSRRYTEYKKIHSRLDYEDLILLTRTLLADNAAASWVMFKLDGGIDHILIDEAQDTSPVQWDIVRYLSAEFFAGKGNSEKKRTVFAVGDRKQSIYSFQGADPDKFDDMFGYFERVAAQDFQKVNMGISFRSSAAVLKMVNELFAKPEISAGVTAAGESVNHRPYRVGEAGKVEIWPLETAQKEEKSTEYLLPPTERKTEHSVKKELAQKIAAEIVRLVKEEHLQYRDIMVLVQTRSSFVDEFIRACKENDININGVDKLKLGEQIAVQDLISLGRFLLLNNDDLSLAEVLKSPLFGLTDEDLLKLCAGRGKAPLWSKLGDFPEYAEIYDNLKTLSDKLDYIRPYELFNYVLTKMNGRHKFTERMGTEVEDALDEFINLTIAYEKEHIPSLQGFIDWIGRSNVEVKRETEQKDADAVRLMTVHGSKGLQAPVVFLPDTVRVKNIKNEQALLWDENMAYYPLSSSCYDDTCLRIKEKNSRKSLEEYRRLLYVALTRAEDRLYICGFCGSNGASESSWYKLCEQTLHECGVENGIKFEIVEPQVIAGKKDKGTTKENLMPQPEDWLYQQAGEESLLAKPYTPSHLDDETDADSVSPLAESGNFYRRGNLIHKLLQFLPQQAEVQEEIIKEYLDKNAADFTEKQREQIKTEVLTLLQQPQFAEIFGQNSKAEVPVVGEIDGKIISAQLDRLVILPQKIMIVDFKTNRPAAKTLADTPESYVKQLAAYAGLVRKIYRGKPVETYILWTNETRLMRVS